MSQKLFDIYANENSINTQWNNRIKVSYLSITELEILLKISKLTIYIRR